MSNSPHSVTPIGLALFSVCADRELVSAALDVTSRLTGAVFVGEFHDYITADKRPQFDSAMTDASACIALIDFDRSPDLALKTAERLRQILSSKVTVIALASQLDAALILQAMRSGCSEYLTKPVAPEALATCLTRFQSSAEVAISVPRNRGQVLALAGAKGGVGTTALAVHLAAHIAEADKKTLLIDAGHDLGHVGLYLGLKDPLYSFDDVLRNAERLDSDLLKGFINRHSSGIDVITSTDQGAAARPQRTPEAMTRAMAVLRREYEWIVMDASVVLYGLDVPVLENTDQTYLVSTTDIGSLRDLSRRVERMALSDTDKAKISLVLNRLTDADAVTPDQVRDTLGIPVAATLPNIHTEMLQAINKGEPLDPRGKAGFTKRMAAWTRSILATGAQISPTKTPSNRLAFWRN